jgi:hypothetical protein
MGECETEFLRTQQKALATGCPVQRFLSRQATIQKPVGANKPTFCPAGVMIFRNRHGGCGAKGNFPERTFSHARPTFIGWRDLTALLLTKHLNDRDVPQPTGGRIDDRFLKGGHRRR